MSLGFVRGIERNVKKKVTPEEIEVEVEIHPSKRWPGRVAYALALFISALVFSSFGIVSSLPFNVWSENSTIISNYCEPQEPHSVREPINAWSSVPFIFVGIWLVTSPFPSDGMFENRWNNFVFPSNLAFTFFGLGVSSFYYHASFTMAWQLLDIFFVRASAVGTLGMSMSLIYYKYSKWIFLTTVCLQLLSMAIMTQVVLAITFGGLSIIEFVIKPRRGLLTGIRSAIASFLLFLLGFFLFISEIYEWICLYSNWFQPHSLWHITSAAAPFILIRSWKL